MAHYEELELQQLMELLVHYTTQYTSMLSNKIFGGEEFTQCKQALAEIHSAIKDRYRDATLDSILPNFPDYIEVSKEGKGANDRHHEYSG